MVYVALAVTGCSRSSSERTFSVDYYRANREARGAMLRACASDPGRLERSANCVNAREAARAEGVGSLKDLPPMGLPQGATRPPGSAGKP
jgi:hypothetical protein